MVNSISRQEIVEVVEKARDYFVPILAPKTIGYYKGVWDKLIAYADESPDKSNVDVRAFYRMVTQAEAYTRPDTRWLRTQARAILALLDLHEGNSPKREYYYKKSVYDGKFRNELNIYLTGRTASGKKSETIRRETILIRDFLIFLEKSGIVSIADITPENLLEFLRRLSPDYSDQWKRSYAYAIRKFLNCPELGLAFPYDVDTLLLGYRHIKNLRLESYYTTEEIKAVMDAVDRNTPWGKTIYAMMLLACVYGLRVSDIRGLQLKSLHWKEKTISLYQIKTKRYVELPLTDGVTLALLDYIKNVRPESDDPHVFLRHTRPYIPYSSKDNFGSKVSYYFKKSGVDTNGKHHGMHSMRHSLATNLLEEDTAVNEIASILGHSSIKSTKPYIWSGIKHLKMCALEVGSYGSR